MIPPLISFELAKKHLRMTSNDLDGEINAKRRLASQIVTNHCKLTAVPEDWISDVEPVPLDESDDLILSRNIGVSPEDLEYIRVPADLQAAILLILSDLFYNGDASTSVLLSDTVIELLRPYRDPTMA